MAHTSHKKRRRTRVGRRPLPGAVPGTFAPDPGAPAPEIHILAYGPDGLSEREIQDAEEIKSLLGEYPVTWIQVTGLGDVEIIRRIGEVFDLHKLVVEDIIHTSQRTKVEFYETYGFAVARTITLGEDLETEQLSLVFGRDYVITFQERADNRLESVQKRIRERRDRIRDERSDYLLYALLDLLVDLYFPILGDFDERLEKLEDEIFTSPAKVSSVRIHDTKRQLRLLRKTVGPIPEVAENLMDEDIALISDTTRLHLRDTKDHSHRVLDIVEAFEGQASDLMDLHLSIASARMNEVMKVLTVIATIFIPLTFITGLYGMNFNTDVSPWNLPELNWYWGYPFALGLMSATVMALAVHFRRKTWL